MKDTGINSFSGKPRWDWSKPKSHKTKALEGKKTHDRLGHLKDEKTGKYDLKLHSKKINK